MLRHYPKIYKQAQFGNYDRYEGDIDTYHYVCVGKESNGTIWLFLHSTFTCI